MDGSNQIGTDHVMRCLALANEAKRSGWESIFVLKDPEDAIVKFIVSCDHRVKKLISSADCEKISYNMVAHGHWLPVYQIQDANETINLIFDLKPSG